MNNLVLIGNITKDVISKISNNGVKISEFTLAVNNSKKGTDFFPCTSFNGTAEFLSKYAKKGDKLAVRGSIHIEKNNDKTYVSVIVDSVDLLTPKAKEETPKVNTSTVEEITDDELPF